MKKTQLLLALMLFGFFSSQSFKLTSKGFVNAEDVSKNYVVLEFEGKKKEDLYKQILILFNKKYKSSKDVISAVEPESITLNAISAKQIRRTNAHSFTNKYNITLSFKDGKIKVDAPIFELYTLDYGKRQEMNLTGGFSLDGSSFGIFNKKGEVKIEKAVEDLNDFANEFLRDIKDSEKGEEW